MTKAKKLYGVFFIGLLALMPLLAVDLPRFLAYGPGIIGLIFTAAYAPVFGGRPSLQKNVFLFAGTIAALALLSALWAIDPGDAIHRAGRASLVLLGGAVLLNLAYAVPAEVMRPKIWLIPAGVMLGALLIVIEMNAGAPVFRLTRGGDFTGPVYPAEFNRGAVALALCAFAAAALLRPFIRRKAMLAGMLLLFFAAFIATTQSQSAQMALILGMIFTFLFPYGRKAAWHALYATIAMLMLAAPFAAPWIYNHYAHAIQNLPGMGYGGAYAGNRLEIWDYVSRYALQKPIFGYGIEATRSITDFDTHQVFQEGTTILHPHNFAIQLWIEFGAFGVLIAAGLAGWLLRTMMNGFSAEQNRVALPTFIACLSVGATAYGLWQGWWLGLLYLAAALCVLAARMAAPAPPQ